MTRTTHIAIRVGEDQLEQAVAHYKAILEVEETGRDSGEVELSGPNFKLYIEPHANPVVLQEFETVDSPNLRERFEAAGCQIFEEWENGFHVMDPYGLNFHVYKKPAAK